MRWRLSKMINKKLLTNYQKDVKFRFKSYKRGMQQGLPMVWDNMMLNLKDQHERSKKVSNKA